MKIEVTEIRTCAWKSLAILADDNSKDECND